jgi:hypothetical protein
MTYIDFFVSVAGLVVFLVFFVAFLAADMSEAPGATDWPTVTCALASVEDFVS